MELVDWHELQSESKRGVLLLFKKSSKVQTVLLEDFGIGLGGCSGPFEGH